MFDTRAVSSTGEILVRILARKFNVWRFFFSFFLCHTVKCRNPTVSVPPLRIHRGSVESGSAAQKKRWVVQGQRGMKGQVEEKDMGPSKERPEIHKPHTTINPSRIHASFSYVCVRRSV